MQGILKPFCELFSSPFLHPWSSPKNEVAKFIGPVGECLGRERKGLSRGQGRKRRRNADDAAVPGHQGQGGRGHPPLPYGRFLRNLWSRCRGRFPDPGTYADGTWERSCTESPPGRFPVPPIGALSAP